MPKFIYKSSLLLLFMIVVNFASAQKQYVLSGTVYDSSDKMPLIGATIYIEELRKGSATGINGNYKIKLDTGTYHLKVSYIGYSSIIQTIRLNGNQKFDFYMKNNSSIIEDVVVTDTRTDENLSGVTLGVEKMKIQAIRQIPALMGEVDIIKAIQLLPGVQSTAEGSSGFSVRGGNIDQNLILIDESTIYNASHLMGFFSIFNNDAIKEIELYKGDIPVAYGGRLSSLLDVKIKEGNETKLAGQGGIGTISSRLTLDGPIGRKATFLIAGRRSYADLFLPFANDPELEDVGLYFYDLNGKFRLKVNSKNTILVSGYMGNDNFANGDFQFGFGNQAAGIDWNHAYSENMYTKVNLHYSKYGYRSSAPISDSSSILWTSSIRDWGMRIDNTVLLDEENTIKFGLTATHHRLFPGFVEPRGAESIFSPFELDHNSALEWGLYGSNVQEIGQRITLRYGLRFAIFQNIGPGTVYDYNSSYNVVDSTLYKKGDVYNVYQGLEPRIGMVYRLNAFSSIKGSYSRTNQFLHLASNSSGGTPFDIWFASNPNVKPQKADQASVGYFRNFFDNRIETSVELYYKHMSNTIDFRDHAQLFLNPYLDGEFRVGTSWAYGAEFLVRFNYDKLNGWISYTLSKAQRDIPEVNKGKVYNAPYDKPHDVGVVLNYAITPRLSFSGTWVYATGIPMTIPAGFYPSENVQLPVYSERNSYRLPDYHRLDLALILKNKQKEGRKWFSEWNFSVYNAYGRHNTWAINFKEEPDNPNQLYAEQTYLFSILPSITYNFKF